MALLDLELDDYDLAEFAGVAATFGCARYGYVVTPNTDHLIRFHDEQSFRHLYQEASFVLLDSRFLSYVFGLAKGVRPPVCAGSDLTAELVTKIITPDDTIVLVGGSEVQAEYLKQHYGLGGLRHYNPPMGFIRDPEAVEACLSFVENHSPFRYCLLAVGAPQQEMLAQKLKSRDKARGLALCIGASINFLTGGERRAPRWMQSAGLEWLFRLLQDPRRLAKRYLVRGPRMFLLLRKIKIVLRTASA
jgi:exopolysaccharide biosynthesis WecB/TagA/CpsF family protein